MFLYVRLFIHDSLSTGVIFAFLSIWFISLILSTFNPYGLYSVSFETYLMLMLNVFSFVFGFSLIRIDRVLYKNVNANSFYTNVMNFVYSKKILLMVILGVLLCSLVLRKYISMLVLYDNERMEAMSMIKENLYSIDYIFFSFFAPPLFYVLNLIMAYMLFFERNKLRISLFMVYILIYSLIGGGRTNFLVILIALLFIYLMGGIKLPKKKKCVLVLFVLCVYVFMSFISAFRIGCEGFSLHTLSLGMNYLNENFITYLTLPFRLLDYSFKENYFDKLGGYHYGIVSFDGINRYTRLLLRLFSVEIDSVYEKTTYMFQNTWVLIGKDYISNYAYTNVIYHYLDFGSFGIFAIPCLFAAFFRWVIKLCYVKKNVSSLALAFYLFYVLIHTVFSWHLNKLYSLGFILFLLFFSLKNKKAHKWLFK